MKQHRTKWIVLAGAVIVALGLGLFIWNAQQPPEGPVPIAWDRDACAECRMHISDPRFAAQLHDANGSVLKFDDPGCLIRYQHARKAKPSAVYFRSHNEDQWLHRTETVFLPVEDSPMGYGIAAVKQGRPSAMTYEQAEKRALTDRHEHSHGMDGGHP